MTDRIESLKQRLSHMASERSGFEAHWQELVDYLLWFRQNIISAGPAGAKRMSKIKDSTGTLALLLFAAGFSSKMANRALPWFSLQHEDEYYKDNREVKVWLDYVEKIFYHTFERSNFYTADQEANIDWGGFGTAPMFVGEHPQWGCFYKNLNLGEVYLASNQYGQTDTLFRKFEFTAKEAVQQWGEDKVSKIVREALDKNKPTERVTILHAVYPRTDRDPGKRDSRNLPWASVYSEINNDHLLEEGGYRQFPYNLSFYFHTEGEMFGRGLGMMALPDIKELQVRVGDTTRAGQLRLSPPVVLPNDMFAGTPIKRIPGGFTFVRADGPMQEKIGVFPVANDLGWAEESNEGMQKRIGRIFHSDLMILAMDKQVTLGEFQYVAQEKMQLLGPALGRLISGRYNPLFDRTFSLLWESGKIPPPPREILGEDGQLKVRVEFISPLAKAQKASESQGIIQATGYLGQAAAIQPGVLDVMDWEGAARVVLENNGVPAKLIFGPEQVAKTRQARQQEQQQAQMAAMALEGAKTLPALSKGPEPGSVMEQMNQALRQGAGNVQ